MLALACFAAAGVFALVRQKASELPIVQHRRRWAGPRRATDGPRNILLVGTDSSAGIDRRSRSVERSRAGSSILRT